MATKLMTALTSNSKSNAGLSLLFVSMKIAAATFYKTEVTTSEVCKFSEHTPVLKPLK